MSVRSKFLLSYGLLMALILLLTGAVIYVFNNALALPEDIKSKLTLLLAVLIGAHLAAAVILYVFIDRLIAGPVKALAETISGSLNKEYIDLTLQDEMPSSDEIGSLSKAFNNLKNRIITALVNVRESLDRTKESVTVFTSEIKNINTGADNQVNDSVEVSASLLEINATIREISEAVAKLHELTEQNTSTLMQLRTSVGEAASNTAYFASFVDETSASIEQGFASIKTINESIEYSKELVNNTLSSSTELSSSVNDVRNSAAKSSKIAGDVVSDIRDIGIKAVDAAVVSMNKIKESASESAVAAEDMSRSSEKIDRVLKVISEVANETKLLALNAAILSAQAGEHGKGFGVVAEEIGRLAERTAQNTKDIALTIGKLKENIRNVVSTGELTQNLISRGSDMITDTGVVLNNILIKSIESAESSAFIRKATDEQATVIQGIGSDIGGLSVLIEDIIRATEQQHAGNMHILAGVDKIKEISHSLNKSTSEFSQGVSLIARSGKEAYDKTSLIKTSMEEIKNGTDDITKRMQAITDVAKDNLALARDITNEASSLAGSVASLEAGINRFRS